MKGFNRLPCTLSVANEDSRTPTGFLAMHWYWPSSVCRASWMAKLPPSTMRTRFEPSKSNFWPPFFQVTVGSGIPRGAAHSRRAVSPWAIRVFCGSRRNSSRRTGWRDGEDGQVVERWANDYCGECVCGLGHVHLLGVINYQGGFCMINAPRRCLFVPPVALTSDPWPSLFLNVRESPCLRPDSKDKSWVNGINVIFMRLMEENEGILGKMTL